MKILPCLAIVGIAAFLGIIGMIVWKQNHVPARENYDAIVVLGAQVKPDGQLSLQLTWRMDEAYTMWEKQPCLIVTCGAQGANEPAPEGQVMKEYLMAKGVPEEQILVDDTSFNTRQNLRNAARLLESAGAKQVMIVTSDYHLPRAMALAQDMGLSSSGKGSPTKAEYWLKNYTREALSWLKYWGQKYLHLPLD